MRYKIIVILLAVVFLNGINNSRELNELAIVSAIGIDKTEEQKYLVSALVINPLKKDSGIATETERDVVLYQEEGDTIQEAVRSIIKESPKRLFLSHLKMLLISEEIAKEDLTGVIDFFVRDFETSDEYSFIIARGTNAEDILKITPKIEETITENIVNSIEVAAEYIGVCNNKTLNDVLSTILEGGEEILIESVSIKETKEEKNEGSSNKTEENKEPAKINQQQKTGNSSNKGDNSSSDEQKNVESNKKVVVNNMSYFKGVELQGFLNEEESIMHNILKNNVSDTLIKVDEKEEKFVAEFIDINSKFKPKYENNEYIIDIKVKGTCSITEIEEKSPDISVETVEEFEKLTEKTLKEKIERYIFNCQNVYNLDLIGFEKIYNKKLNKEYKKVSRIFKDEIFKNIKTNVEVEVEIPNEGGIFKKW